MEKKKEKMTLEKLAEMTQRGFKALEDGLRKEIKNEVGGLRNEMKGEIGGLKGEIGELKNRMDGMDGKFDRLLTGQDHILKRLENLETDNTMGAGASRRQEDKLENHEERGVVVEEELEINPVV